MIPISEGAPAPTPEPETHHKFAPSSMKFRAICPGFDQDQTGDSSKADLGTLSHKAFELGDLSILPTKESRDAVRKCLKIAVRLEKGADEIHKEVRLSILGGLTYGTSDEVIIKKTHADVLDEKYGLLPIDDPKENWQGWSYASGVFDRWPKLQTVTVWFLIPYRDEVLQHTFSRAEFVGINLKLRIVIERAKKFRESGSTYATRDASFLKMTEEGCTYCAHKAECPASVDYALATTKKYAPLELVDDVHSSQITEPAKMVKLLRASKILEKMCESVNQHARTFAAEHGGLHDETGKMVYKLASRASPRKIKNIGAAIDVFREHLTDGELLLESDISLTGCLDRIANKAARGQKAKLRGAVETKLAEADALSCGEPTYFLTKVRE